MNLFIQNLFECFYVPDTMVTGKKKCACIHIYVYSL